MKWTHNRTCAHRDDDPTMDRLGSEQPSKQRKETHRPSNMQMAQRQKKPPYIKSPPAESRVQVPDYVEFCSTYQVAMFGNDDDATHGADWNSDDSDDRMSTVIWGD